MQGFVEELGAVPRTMPSWHTANCRHQSFLQSVAMSILDRSSASVVDILEDCKRVTGL